MNRLFSAIAGSIMVNGGIIYIIVCMIIADVNFNIASRIFLVAFTLLEVLTAIYTAHMISYEYHRYKRLKQRMEERD